MQVVLATRGEEEGVGEVPGVMVEVVVVEVAVGIVAGVVDMLDLNPIPHLWYVNLNIYYSDL